MVGTEEIEQYNTFDTFTIDCWKDRVYYDSQEFPAGYFAAEILNYAGEVDGPLLGRISTLIPLVSQAAVTDRGSSLLADIKPVMQEAVSWLCSCPPFCCHNNRLQWDEFALAMDADRFDQDCADSSERLPVYFLSFSEQVLKDLIAIYNFCLLTRAFEKKYLRRLKRRTESAFAKAAHECFDEDDSFIELQEHMPFGEVEEFFSFPRLITGFSYVRNPEDKGAWITVQQVVCNRLIDFYVFDLLNGLRHGHGPSWCRNCHRYFLTTTAHTPKYCDGVAPQNQSMTCRQYGAMMQQKELNSDHPVYRVFSTRTNTIRKHHQRGKIDNAIREMAIRVAEEHRDRALLDKTYLAQQYEKDMEQENVYAEARRRLAGQGRTRP